VVSGDGFDTADQPVKLAMRVVPRLMTEMTCQI
jgi:hypothetical protein